MLSACPGQFVTLGFGPFTSATAYCGRETGNEQGGVPWGLLDALRKRGGLGRLCGPPALDLSGPRISAQRDLLQEAHQRDHSGTADTHLKVFILPSWEYTQVFGAKCV